MDIVSQEGHFFSRWIKASGWYPDYQLRLLQKDKGKFNEKEFMKELY